MSFTPAHLLQQLVQLPAARRYWVAYSGGSDSHVLLHTMATLREQLAVPVHAVHVNHGLQSQANEWEAHCQQVCEGLSIPLELARVDAAHAPGESPEEAAREARYRVFAGILQDDDMLLMAHHQDDQAETLMLQMLRGAGVKGLAAMPDITRLGRGWLARPLLGFTRSILCHYARQQGLIWIDDPSNNDTRFDRNFLRHEVMPLLHQRWPATANILSRVAGHMAEGASLLRQLAEQDLVQHRVAGKRLVVSSLLTLDVARQRNLLRHWLSDVCKLSTPDRKHLNRIVHEVLPADENANPVVSWRGGEVRRYRGELYALQSASIPADMQQIIPWDGKQALNLDKQVLIPHLVKGQGVNRQFMQQDTLSVRFRQGGEKCRPVGRAHHHSLKKLFQEWGVPPWQRESVPLLCVGDDIAQVVGYCICEPYQTNPQQEGLVITLESAQA